jgi:4,5-DOPA dioxygenase extradiol
MKRLPTLFVSHGAPTYALEPGLAGAQLGELGRRLRRPEAIAVVSAHWQANEVRVGTSSRPETVHDFGGFPAPLYALRYPAPGAPEHALRALQLLQQAGWAASADAQRGLDHGAWVPLLHLFPTADIPVFQIAMPLDLDEAGALRLGRSLAPLADEGVLLIGSGSLTHNLRELRFGDARGDAYVQAFADWAAARLRAGQAPLLHEAPQGRRAHPTDEHYLPLLVAAGAAVPGATVEELDGGIEHGVLAMRSYRFEPLHA